MKIKIKQNKIPMFKSNGPSWQENGAVNSGGFLLNKIRCILPYVTPQSQNAENDKD